MPHIKQNDRAYFNGSIINIVNTLRHKFDQSKFTGNLSYITTKIIAEYFKREGYNFRLLNEIDGFFGTCQSEFRRLILHPYEDKKIEENGSAYD